MGVAIVEAESDLETELHDNKEELKAKLMESPCEKSYLFNSKNPEEDKILGRTFGHVHSGYWSKEQKKHLSICWTNLSSILLMLADIFQSLDIGDASYVKSLAESSSKQKRHVPSKGGTSIKYPVQKTLN